MVIDGWLAPLVFRGCDGIILSLVKEGGEEREKERGERKGEKGEKKEGKVMDFCGCWSGCKYW